MRIDPKEVMSALPSAEKALVQVAYIVEHRVPNFEGHQERLAQYSAIIGRYMELSYAEAKILIKAAFLHDIGMITVPEATLLKPEKLTPQEQERAQKHPLEGVKILSSIASLRPTIPIVQYHHERVNGQGYPDGLKGPDIPLLAQIFSVLDVYDALTSPRSYRSAYSSGETIKILKEEAEWGLHNRDFIDLFCELVEGGLAERIDLGWRYC